MKLYFIAGAIVWLLMLALSVYVYPQMPDTMISHWGLAGQADGHAGKFMALFLVPLISGVMLVILTAVPSIDPLHANIKKFSSHYGRFIVLMMGFFLYIHAITILLNMGYAFSINQALSPAFGALFYYCGILISNAKRNWFIGIRTPWTMSSDSVWNKTHKLGGKLFRVAGVVSLAGIVVYDYAIIFMLVPVIAFSVLLVAYSYVEYRKEKK